MLDFGPSMAMWLAATIIPVYIGLLAALGASSRIRQGFVAAFALGVFLWFFVDTIQGSSNLEAGAGFTGGLDQLAIVTLFAVGLVSPFILGRWQRLHGNGAAGGMAVPIVVAVALGIHGLGEGSAFGTTASSTSVTSVFGLFSLETGTSYALHKALEAVMVGACYLAYGARGTGARLKDAVTLSLAFSIPSFLGAVTGYYVAVPATYFFAVGTGTSVFAAVRLSGFLWSRDYPTAHEAPLATAFAILLGVIAIYLASLLHGP